MPPLVEQENKPFWLTLKHQENASVKKVMFLKHLYSILYVLTILKGAKATHSTPQYLTKTPIVLSLEAFTNFSKVGIYPPPPPPNRVGTRLIFFRFTQINFHFGHEKKIISIILIIFRHILWICKKNYSFSRVFFLFFPMYFCQLFPLENKSRQWG